MTVRGALRPALLIVLAAAGCTGTGEPPPAPAAPPPPPRVQPGTEPIVRVWLRSLGDWDALTVRVEGGRRDDPRDAAVGDAAVDVALVREGTRVRVAGGARRHERLVLRPAGGVFSIGTRAWSGDLAIVHGRLVNHVALENYLLGVLRGELPLGDVPVQAAAAQAIAARSYTLHYLTAPPGGRTDGRGTDWDVDDTTMFQVYAGLRYAPDDDALRRAVLATRAMYLAHDDRPVKAYYHSTCGGHTTDVPTGLRRDPSPVLPGVPCTDCEGARYWRWDATLTEAEVLAAAGMTGPLQEVAVAARGPGDRALDLRITAAGRTREVGAANFRLRVGASRLRSTRILSVGMRDGAVVLHGAGWGHGVGLCQLGAIGRARRGMLGRDIALAYYPGAAIERWY